jgi:hypothetical protein
MLYDVMDAAGFPQEAQDYFILKERELLRMGCAEQRIADAVAAVCTDGAEFLPLLEALAADSGVPRYASDMIVLLYAAEKMAERYKEAGLSDEIYLDTISDLRNKLYECKKLKGEWGTFVAWWLAGYFRLKRFALGRLQYEVVEHEGKPALNCHIPSGSPLNFEAVTASLRKAYDFYPQVRFDGKITVVCHSWLLYPPHRELFSDGGNLRRFVDLFTITESTPDPKNQSLWLIFYKNYNSVSLDELPTDTTLRRAFVKYLRDGNCMGYGRGYLVFDGEKVVSK